MRFLTVKDMEAEAYRLVYAFIYENKAVWGHFAVQPFSTLTLPISQRVPAYIKMIEEIVGAGASENIEKAKKLLLCCEKERRRGSDPAVFYEHIIRGAVAREVN